MVEGWRSLESALNAGIPLEWLLVSGNPRQTPEQADLLDRLSAKAIRTDAATREQMDQLTHAVTPSDLAGLVVWRPFGPDEILRLLSRPDRRPGRSGEPRRVVVVVDRLADPGNLGTIIRTADWFGADAVFAGPGSVEVTNPKVVQATMGSLFQIPVGEGDSTGAFLDSLHSAGFRRVSLQLDGGTDLREVVWPEKVALVVGNEAHGVSAETRDRADLRVMIPGFGRAESLNAAVAVAVVLGRIVLG